MIRFNKPTIEKKDLESVLYCMITDDLTPGVYMKEFRTQLNRLLGLNMTLVLNSYFQAFEAAFRLLEAKPGDEVILSSFSRIRIYRAILSQGLQPVIIDLDEHSLLPSIAHIKRKINPRTRCVIVQQLFGIPNDLSSYRELGVPLLEDLDGALCSSIRGKSLGSFGSLVTMNFNDDAVITTGNGGMLASRDRALKEIYAQFLADESHNDYMMSDFNASLGISQLRKLEKNCERRRKIGKHFDRAVLASNCSLVGREDDQQLCYSSYPVLTDTPFEDCHRFFKKYSIPVRRGVESPLHHIAGLPPRDYENTEAMFNKIVLLPLYPTLDGDVVENIVRGIKSIL
jgi:dTDP-4-amino-4,6-dideoxygalactose transaminase